MQNFKCRGDLNLVARDCSKRVEFCLPSGNTPTLEQTVLVSLTKIDFLYFLLTVCNMKHNKQNHHKMWSSVNLWIFSVAKATLQSQMSVN